MVTFSIAVKLDIYKILIGHLLYIQIIRLLLASGSDVNMCESEHHQSPLFAALLHEYIEVVHVLISVGRFCFKK